MINFSLEVHCCHDTDLPAEMDVKIGCKPHLFTHLAMRSFACSTTNTCAAQWPCSISPNRSASWLTLHRYDLMASLDAADKLHRADVSSWASIVQADAPEAYLQHRTKPEALAGSTLPALLGAQSCLRLLPPGPRALAVPAPKKQICTWPGNTRKSWLTVNSDPCTVSQGRWTFHIWQAGPHVHLFPHANSVASTSGVIFLAFRAMSLEPGSMTEICKSQNTGSLAQLS